MRGKEEMSGAARKQARSRFERWLVTGWQERSRSSWTLEDMRASMALASLGCAGHFVRDGWLPHDVLEDALEEVPELLASSSLWPAGVVEVSDEGSVRVVDEEIRMFLVTDALLGRFPALDGVARVSLVGFLELDERTSTQLEAELRRGEVLGERVNLSHTAIEGIDLSGVDLSKSNLEQVRLRDATLTATNFSRANLTAALFDTPGDLTGADFSEVRARELCITFVGMRGSAKGASFAGADLRAASLSMNDFTGASFEGADLSWCDLSQVSFGPGALRHAQLRCACFYLRGRFGASLEGFDLRGANLDGADLFRAKLRGASLAGASLRHARLGQADLRNVDATGADTTGADFLRARLDGALGLASVDPGVVCGEHKYTKYVPTTPRWRVDYPRRLRQLSSGCLELHGFIGEPVLVGFDVSRAPVRGRLVELNAVCIDEASHFAEGVWSIGRHIL